MGITALGNGIDITMLIVFKKNSSGIYQHEDTQVIMSKCLKVKSVKG
jgi:hypothetical protein